MPGRVTDYTTRKDHDVAPKTLHGVQEVKMMIIQCADQHSETKVLLGIEIEPGDIRILPENTWNNLGKPAPWLQEQLDEVLGVTKKAAEKPTKKAQKRKKNRSNVPMDNAV